MKNFIFYLFLFASYLNANAQNEKAIVTTDLNLREEESKNSQSIKILNEGDTIEILSKDPDWTKVIAGNDEGFVSTAYISKINTEIKSADTSVETDGNNTLKNLLIYGLLIFIVGYVLYWLFDKRCKNCGQFGSLRKKHSELIDSKPTKVKEVLKRYNKKGEVTSKREVLVDATIKRYRNYYECNKCSDISTRITSVTYKN